MLAGVPEVSPVPLTAASICSKWRAPKLALLDHLVGAGKERRRHVKAERLCCFEVDNELIFGWGMHRKISRFLAFKNAIDITGSLPVCINRVWSVTDQAAIRRRKSGPDRLPAIDAGLQE